MTEVEELYRVIGRKAGRVALSGTKKRKKISGPIGGLQAGYRK
jgi:hypothetical protein